MKSNAFAKVLESYAHNSLPPNSSEDWATLARVFASAKMKTVADFVSELRKLEVRPLEASRGLGAILPEIQPMQATANALGKAPFAAALEHLRQLAEQHPSVAAQAVESALAVRARAQPSKGRNKRQAASKDPSIVPGYNNRLEEALGDDSGFEELMGQLEADKRLSVNDFKQLAKLFAGSPGRNKGDALEAIRARHRNLMDARAKQRFNAGQTAA